MRPLAPAAAIQVALASAALLCPQIASAAQTTVGPGPGFDHAQITSALAVANPGDTLLVAPGTYDGFAVTIPVSILGAGSDQVVVKRTQTGDGVRISGIPAGGTVRISGLEVERTDFFPGANAFVAVEDCSGVVILSDLLVSAEGFPSVGEAGHASVEIANSDQVMIDNSSFVGWPAPPGAALLNGVSGMRAVDSELFLSGVTLTGGYGGAQFNNGGLGAPALVVDGGIAIAARCDLHGGRGGAFYSGKPLLSYSFSGAPAIDARGAVVVLHGGPENRIEGGDGNQTDVDEWSGGGAAVKVDWTSYLRYAADVVLVPGMNGDFSPGTVQVQTAPGSVVVAEPIALPTLQAPSLATLGSPIALELSGEPGNVAAVFVTLDPIAAFAVAGIDGAILVDPLLAALLPPEILDGAGLATEILAVPNDPVLTGVGFTLQSLEVGGAAPRASNATTAVALP